MLKGQNIFHESLRVKFWSGDKGILIGIQTPN